MMTSGGLFNRTLLVVNPNPSILVPSTQAEKIGELSQYEEQDWGLMLTRFIMTNKYITPTTATLVSFVIRLFILYTKIA